MWKSRVRTCLEKAISELLAEAENQPSPDMTIRTELDYMVHQTRMHDIAKRMKAMLAEIEQIPERKNPHG